ncbi:MAG: lamin tail domain-containing protein [Kofleriaceae bacterium]|nr:lamin tail domain-containing protein [Kofleriaceae bacterium]
MRTSLLASFLLLAAACGDNGDTNTVDARPRPDGRPPSVDADPNAPDADPSAPDAPAGTPDAPAGNPDAPPTSGPSPLIISEVRNNGAEEFVEIYNPNAAAVDLRNYYLSDAPSFWMLPGHPTTPIVLDASDFLERFPAGASIPAGGVITIAMNGPGFTTRYAADPTYSTDELAGTTVAMETTVMSGGANPNPGITNGGEVVILFYWDGASDRVQDVDIVLAGPAATSAANRLPAAGMNYRMAVDGPDADAVATAYAPDALTLQPMAAALVDADPLFPSYKRLTRDGAASEVQTGGNGIAGNDETSEQQLMTWDGGTTAGTPGAVPTTLSTP